MATLKSLNKAQLESLAEECGFQLKKGNRDSYIQQISDAIINKNKLQELVDKYYKLKLESKGRLKGSSSSEFETRITQLESNVKYLLEKVLSLESKIGHSIDGKYKDLESVKNNIKSLMRTSESLSVDVICNDRKLRKYEWDVIEKALIELLDEEYLDKSDGASRNRINGKIGRVIRH